MALKAAWLGKIICFLSAMGCRWKTAKGQLTHVHRTSVYLLHRLHCALQNRSTPQKSKEHLSFEILPVCIKHLSSLKCFTQHPHQCKSQFSNYHSIMSQNQILLYQSFYHFYYFQSCTERSFTSSLQN